MKNKKALTVNIVIFLILSIITFVILTYYIINVLQESNYNSDLADCNLFYKNLNGQNIYFSDEITNYNLILMTSNLCPAKVTDVSSLKDIDSLYKNCMKEFNFGKNILGDKDLDQNICIYCGSLNFKKKRTSNFFDDYNSFLNKEKDTDRNSIFLENGKSYNLNSYFLIDNQLIKRDINRVAVFAMFSKNKFYEMSEEFIPGINFVSSENKNKIINFINENKQLPEPVFYLFLAKESSNIYNDVDLNKLLNEEQDTEKTLKDKEINNRNYYEYTNPDNYLANKIAAQTKKDALGIEGCDVIIIPKKIYN
jgi:hypothetical protein